MTGKQENPSSGFGLEIPATKTCNKLEKAVVWIQRKKSEEMETNEKVKSKCLNGNLDCCSSPVCWLGRIYNWV